MSKLNTTFRTLVIAFSLAAFAPTLALAQTSTTTCEKVDLGIYVWEKCKTTTTE